MSNIEFSQRLLDLHSKIADERQQVEKCLTVAAEASGMTRGQAHMLRYLFPYAEKHTSLTTEQLAGLIVVLAALGESPAQILSFLEAQSRATNVAVPPAPRVGG